MKCKKCGHNNVTQASFCFKCGNNFTKEEKELAIKKSFITKYNKLKEWYDKLTLSKITSHIVFKIVTVLIVLFIGVYSIYKDGTRLKVIDGEGYSYKYNNKLNEYYLYLDKEESSLNLYLPHYVNTYKVSYYDSNDKELESNNYDSLDDIVIKIDDVSNYYKISYDDSNDYVKIFALRGNSNE